MTYMTITIDHTAYEAVLDRQRELVRAAELELADRRSSPRSRPGTISRCEMRVEIERALIRELLAGNPDTPPFSIGQQVVIKSGHWAGEVVSLGARDSVGVKFQAFVMEQPEIRFFRERDLEAWGPEPVVNGEQFAPGYTV